MIGTTVYQHGLHYQWNIWFNEYVCVSLNTITACTRYDTIMDR